MLDLCLVGSDKQRSYEGDYMRTGKEAERIVMDWLKKQPGVLEVESLVDLRPMQRADVDCSFTLGDGRVTFAEIKSDKHLGVGKNVLFEVLRINHTCHTDSSVTLGWTARSPAIWLLYYSPVLHRIYKCRFEDLRRVFQEWTQKTRKQTRFDYVCTDNIKSTVNALIPFSECESIFTIYDLPA